MSNYTKVTNFASKDSLPANDTGKIVKGAEIDTEFNGIATSIATKADLASPTFSGTPTVPNAADGTNSTQIASTAFVNTAITNERTASVTLTNKTLTSPFVNQILHEGTADDFETTLAFTDPTADRTITFPNKTGTVALTSDIGSTAAVTTASGNYAMSGSQTVTVTVTSHGRTVGESVYLNFTSGDATDGNYPIASVLDANNFTVTEEDSLTTSGSVTVHYSNIGPTALISNDEALRGESTTKAMTAAATKSLIDANFVRETAKATTSGNNIDFTGIPSWVKRITIMMSLVSHNAAGANSDMLIQIGDAGGIEVADYESASGDAGGTDPSSKGFNIKGSDASGRSVSGIMILSNISGNTWVATHGFRVDSNNAVSGGGTKTLSNTLTQIRLTTIRNSDGTTPLNVFDAGEINILYE